MRSGSHRLDSPDGPEGPDWLTIAYVVIVLAVGAAMLIGELCP